MNKIIYILLFCILSLFSKAQYPLLQSIGSDSAMVKSKAGLWGGKGLVNGSYIDTTAANLTRIRQYPGAQIFTTIDTSIWLRNNNATKWILQASSSNITTLLQDFLDSSIHKVNDSTLIICPVSGSCDTIHLGNSNTYYFLSIDTLVTCDTVQIICIGDSCYQQQLCDTIPITAIIVPVYQNLLRLVPNTPIREAGNTEGNLQGSMIHDTWFYTNGYKLNVQGSVTGGTPLSLKQNQWTQLGSSIMEFNHYGAYHPNWGLLDSNGNAVNLYINYTNPFVIPSTGGLAGDTIGFMGSRYGYMLMTNSLGNYLQYDINDYNAKQVGIFFDTYTNNNEAVTIFGNQLPSAYAFGNNPAVDSTLLDARIAVFKTNGQVQLPQYITGAFPITLPTYIIAQDASGNLFQYPSGGLGGGGLLFARDDARNNSAGNAYFSNAGLDFTLDSNSTLSLNANWFEVVDYTTGNTRIRTNSTDSRVLSPDGSLSLQMTNSSLALSGISSGTTTLTNLRLELDTAQITAANDLVLGQGNVFLVSGNTQINAITTASWKAGSAPIYLVFSGIPLVKNNTAGGGGTATILLAGRTDFQAAAGDVLSLMYDGTNWYETNRTLTASAGITGITADNGLTASTATNVQLGGTLIQNTEINTNTKYLWLNGTNAPGQYTFLATSTTGNTAWISSGSGNALLISVAASSKTGVEVQASGGALPYYSALTSSGTNDILPSLVMKRASSGTAAAGIGTSTEYWAQIAENSTMYLTNQLISKWTDPATATRTSQLDITGVNSASTGTIASFYGSGVVGIGISSSYTATRLNVVDNAVGAASIVDITSTSTAAASNLQKGINISLSGTNATALQTTYGVYSSNSHAGTTSTNYGVYATATNGATNDIGVYGTASGGSINIGVWGDNTGSGIGVEGTTATGQAGFFTASSSGTGVFSTSSSGTGVTAQSTTGQAISSTINPSSTNSIATVGTIGRTTTSTAALGLGGEMLYRLENASGSQVTSNRIIWMWSTTPTASSETSLLSFTGISNGNTDTLLKMGDYVSLTESSATTFAKTTVASSRIAGGEITVTIEANDATDYQARTLRFIWSAVNKVGTTTITISTPEEVASVSAGTLTATITATDDGSGVISFKANAVSSLTQTTLRCSYQMSKNF